MQIFSKLLAALCAVFLLPSVVSAQISNCNWPHRIAVNAAVGTAGLNGDLRISLTSGDFPASYNLSPAGNDLRVFQDDGTTPVPFFISDWNPVARTSTVYILPPAVPAGGSATYFFDLGNLSVASASDASSVFTVPGIRVTSRVSTADPTDTASARAAFDSATTTVANVVRSDVFNLSNQVLGGSFGDYGMCISTLLDVPAGQAGVWDFRYGPDFGRGGHLQVDETDLEADWNDDLFWGFSFASPDTLAGSRFLSAGFHRLEALGFEGCCDGAEQFQARPPGGVYTDVRTSNFSLWAANCANLTITLSSASLSCPISLNVEKNVSTINDTLGTNFALPDSVVTYDIQVSNEGQRIDNGAVIIDDILPVEGRLVVAGANAFELIDGPTASGVSFSWIDAASATDDVFFSTDGTDFSYLPTPDAQGADDAVTHVRIIPSGSLNPTVSGSVPAFTIRLQMIVE